MYCFYLYRNTIDVLGRSNEHMFRFTGVDLMFILYHPFAYVFEINIYLVDKVSAVIRRCMNFRVISIE
jgi:hypothetical protein